MTLDAYDGVLDENGNPMFVAEPVEHGNLVAVPTISIVGDN